jgi:HPt (histidine-containing phosphotransfer) domain-containing protein
MVNGLPIPAWHATCSAGGVTVQHPCTALFESIGHDEAALAELVDIFLEDAPPRVAAICAAVQEHDDAVVAREAHAYKGAAAVLEAAEVAECAHQLEVMGRSGNLVGAVEIAERLDTCSAILFETLRRFRISFPCAA